MANTSATYDSYVWNLIKILQQKKSDKIPYKLFDFVYFDGAHTYLFDAAAVSFLKLLIKPGGYILFYDMFWTIAVSPTCNPHVNKNMTSLYTME